MDTRRRGLRVEGKGRGKRLNFEGCQLGTGVARVEPPPPLSLPVWHEAHSARPVVAICSELRPLHAVQVAQLQDRQGARLRGQVRLRAEAGGGRAEINKANRQRGTMRLSGLMSCAWKGWKSVNSSTGKQRRGAS